MTYGKVLAKLPVAVDYWKLPKSHEKFKTYLYFLTHMHADHTQGLSSSWTETIYTSQINKDLLITMLNVRAELIKPLDIGVPYVLPLPIEHGNVNNDEERNITVTLIDANHIRGSVMFLFEGIFGRFLYTGDFRWSDSMVIDPILENLASSKNLNRLYVDNTFEESNCEFPTRDECMEHVLQLVKKHPYHRIIFGCQKIGKEDVLLNVAKARKEKMFVPETVFEIYRTVGLPVDDWFTTKQSESVLWYEPLHKVYQYDMRQKNLEMPTIAITLTASGLLNGSGKPREKDLTFTVPFSNHCSAPELTKFLDFLQPELVDRIVPVKKKPTHASVIDNYLAGKPAELTDDDSTEVDVSCDERYDETASFIAEEPDEFLSARSNAISQALNGNTLPVERKTDSESEYKSLSEPAVSAQNDEAIQISATLSEARRMIDALNKELDENPHEEYIHSNKFIEQLQTLTKLYRPITGLHPSMYYEF